MLKSGLFVGLVTLDLIYLTENFPHRNQKIVAKDYVVTAGGPATNAGITFSYLGNHSKLAGVVGNNANASLIKADLETYQVNLLDLNPSGLDSPPVSSIIVTASTGERAVISINAKKTKARAEILPNNLLEKVNLVLIDGHQMAVSEAIASQAKVKQIPVVIDGGSWKSGWEDIFPYVDYAICSANFYPPGCQTTEDVVAYLINIGIPNIAITQGEKPILYFHEGNRGEIPVPSIKAVDTLGAGDIFHGAFCHYLLTQDFDFTSALTAASKIASLSCRYFGTRQWMKEFRG